MSKKPHIFLAGGRWIVGEIYFRHPSTGARGYIEWGAGSTIDEAWANAHPMSTAITRLFDQILGTAWRANSKTWRPSSGPMAASLQRAEGGQ